MRFIAILVALGLLVSGCRMVAGYEAAKADGAADAGPVADGVDAGAPEAALPCPPWSNGGCPDPRQLALGIDFSCLLVGSGAVYCWGDNIGGILGQPGPDTATPQLVKNIDLQPGPRGAQQRQLAAGGAHVCGIDRNGAPICWGYNGDGQVAPEGKPDWFGPTAVVLPAGELVVSLAAGHRHTCALTGGGRVFCWGNDERGRLSDGVVVASGVVKVPLGQQRALTVGCGFDHCCALLEDRKSVACWGDNEEWQLGDSAAGAFSAKPWVSAPDVAPIQRLVCGGRSCCAQGGPGGDALLCWGDNRAGQLGIGQTGPPQGPTTPALDDVASVVTAVRLGGAHGCVRRENGAASCWGYSIFGQTLALPAHDYGKPLPLAEQGYEELALGLLHSCAIRDGGVECWGRNRAGALGDGEMHRRATPQPIAGALPGGVPSLLAVGDYHTCAADSGDQLYCWGRNDFLQSASTPSWAVAPTLLAKARVDKLVALGGAHGCGREVGTKKPICWGGSWAKQAGVDQVATPPMTLDTWLTVEVVAAGDEHSCVVAGGTVYCWGSNRQGQLGLPASDIVQATPQPITALGPGIKRIVARRHATCVIDPDDQLRCWGDAEQQQIGTPDPMGLSNPLPGIDVAQVTLGERHGCALTKDDKVLCWGDDSDGRLGVEASTNAYEQVQGLSKTAALAAGGGFTCALDEAGLVRCWGLNQHGELGTEMLGSSPLRSSFIPQQIPLTDKARVIGAGIGHVCAILADGTIVCWGDTSFGALGDGKAPSRVPRVILPAP